MEEVQVEEDQFTEEEFEQTCKELGLEDSDGVGVEDAIDVDDSFFKKLYEAQGNW